MVVRLILQTREGPQAQVPRDDFVVAQGDGGLIALLLGVHLWYFSQVGRFGVEGAKSAPGIQLIEFDELLVKLGIGIFFPSKNIPCLELFPELRRLPTLEQLDHPREESHILLQQN